MELDNKFHFKTRISVYVVSYPCGVAPESIPTRYMHMPPRESCPRLHG